MKQSAFIAALKFASHAAASKDIRYYLNGVLFEFRGTTLTLVGTDGHRMAYVELEADVNDYTTTLDFIVSAESVKLLLAAYKGASTGRVSFEASADNVGTPRLTVRGSQSVECRSIKGKYPDWRRVCKSGARPVATEEIGFNVDYIAAAAKACGALSSSKYKVAKFQFYGPSEAVKVSPDELPVGVNAAWAVVMPVRL